MPLLTRPHVQVRPEVVQVHRSLPKSPSLSPRGVHFPSTTSLVTSYSRPLTSTEAWSLYYFETHARNCSKCFDPYARQTAGKNLCTRGSALAQDTALHVKQGSDSHVYSTQSDRSKSDRVEVPPGYDSTRSLLKALRKRPVVVNQPAATKRTSEYHANERRERAEVIVEPSRSRDHGRGRQRSRYGVEEVSREERRYRADSVMKSTARPKYRTELVEPERRVWFE